MRTQRLKKIDIDQDAVGADLERSARIAFSDAYSEYLCGGPWKSCMLWAPGGENRDGLVTNYDVGRRSARTENGNQLAYISGLVERYFNPEYLNFARLVVISNSVIIPHRDLLELKDVSTEARNVHRVHIPLVTNEESFFLQDNTVYRMRSGEIWFFDASSWHSAASFSGENRVHLLLDFADVDDSSKLLRFTPRTGPGIPQDSIYSRKPMTDAQRKALLSLSSVINMENYRDVFSIVIKNQYRRDGGDRFIWNTILQIARSSKNAQLCDKVEAMHKYFLIERAA